ncbi:DedA family protein [Kitasatospora sp. NBC_00374]|uniref:DedA family protein n=1 Tax=Kitasatospora sp. NBC_00374 TaxID=2975964 RepID=UPI0030DEB94A
MTSSLPGPLSHLAPLLDDYGYPAVGLLVFLDNCGVPVPGQTILVLAAVYAGTGQLSIAGVAAIAVVAAIAGDSAGYLIGHRGGPLFVQRWGRYLRLTPARMGRAEGFFARHGGKVVTVARFVDGLRQTNGIVAGATRMPLPRFMAANVAGALLWVGFWASAAYLAGNNIGTLYEQAVRYQLYLLAALGLLLLALLVRRLLRRRRGPQNGASADAPPGGAKPTDGQPGAGQPGGESAGERPCGGQPRSGTTSKDEA